MQDWYNALQDACEDLKNNEAVVMVAVQHYGITMFSRKSFYSLDIGVVYSVQCVLVHVVVVIRTVVSLASLGTVTGDALPPVAISGGICCDTGISN